MIVICNQRSLALPNTPQKKIEIYAEWLSYHKQENEDNYNLECQITSYDASTLDFMVWIEEKKSNQIETDISDTESYYEESVKNRIDKHEQFKKQISELKLKVKKYHDLLDMTQKEHLKSIELIIELKSMLNNGKSIPFDNNNNNNNNNITILHGLRLECSCDHIKLWNKNVNQHTINNCETANIIQYFYSIDYLKGFCDKNGNCLMCGNVISSVRNAVSKNDIVYNFYQNNSNNILQSMYDTVQIINYLNKRALYWKNKAYKFEIEMKKNILEYSEIIRLFADKKR